MDERELQRWNLPGYTAFAHGEPFPWAWAVLWSVWGLTIAGLIVWSDGAWPVAGIFLAWGALMGCYGWRAVTVGAAVIHDWAKSHCTDPNVEMAAIREMIEVTDSARDRGEWDEENWEMPDTPIQRRWTEEELFTAMFSIPWVMGLIHGVGIGGLVGAVLALVTSTGVSVTTSAVAGALGGAVLVTFLVALFTAMLSFFDASAAGWSPRQRMLLGVSPLLAVPALAEAVVLWLRWYANQGRD